jgi:hypothetical protein
MKTSEVPIIMLLDTPSKFGGSLIFCSFRLFYLGKDHLPLPEIEANCKKATNIFPTMMTKGNLRNSSNI